jgi:hypothetical protein
MKMRRAEHVELMGERKNVYRLLVRKPEGTKPLGRKDLDGWIILRWTP